MWPHDTSIVLIDREDAYRRFLSGDRVVVEDAVGIRDGPCLTAPRHRFRFGPRESLLATLEHLWLAENRAGKISREAEQPLRHLLPGSRSALEGFVKVFPMRSLERWMCSDAYKKLYDTGNFTGILNRAWRHLECCMDSVWIEDDVCMLWTRSDAAASVRWIKLFPFRVDRSDV